MKNEYKHGYLTLILAMLFWPLSQSNAAEHIIEMTAEKIAQGSGDSLLAYKMVSHTVGQINITSRYSSVATIPGPTIVLTEGDTVRLTIRNGINVTDQQVSVHVHGVHYKILSDGTLASINKVRDEGAYPSDFYTYLWTIAPGTAGTWPYHDHNFTTHNGAEVKGLFGAVIVNPASGMVIANSGSIITSVPVGSIKKDYVLYLGDDAFWGMGIDGSNKHQTSLGVNPLLAAHYGDNVRFHLIALGTYVSEFNLRGYRWVDPGTVNLIHTKAIGPLEKHVFTIKASQSTTYENTNFSRKLMGMKGNFHVTH